MKIRRFALPSIVFIGVWIVHATLRMLFSEHSAVQTQWANVQSSVPMSAWHAYLSSGAYYQSYVYALSLAFAAVALRRYLERRSCSARNAALGGVGLSGALAFAGCFLVGCCGSPMLAVYVSLFGAKFLPFAKPLMAAITTLLIFGTAIWMVRKDRTAKGSCC